MYVCNIYIHIYTYIIYVYNVYIINIMYNNILYYYIILKYIVPLSVSLWLISFKKYLYFPKVTGIVRII